MNALDLFELMNPQFGQYRVRRAPQNARPAIDGGSSRCARKGHRPVNTHGLCSRCNERLTPEPTIE